MTFQKLDRVLAMLLAILALAINLGMRLDVTTPILVAVGLIAPGLLWLSSPASITALLFFSPCCGMGSYVFCDASPGDRWGILHVAHDWLWLLLPYSIVRLMSMWLFRESKG